MSTQADNKRIAKNTLVLYIRMLCMMFIGLYTSRVNLQSLGVEDYGIYNVVGGIVVMFSIINGSITASISRFLTFELGARNINKLKKVFSTSVTIQIAISLVILILSETIGLWFLNHKMVIPEQRINAANWVYQFSILTFILNMISMPYNACIVAHEKMSAFAWITIYDAITRLLIAWLTFISPIDKLIFYSGLVTLIALTQRMIYSSYCIKHFEECKYKFIYDKSLLKEMSGFAGWNLIGVSSAVLRDTGGNIVINLFCGPSVNAARAIASQVNSAVQSFATSFTTSINPQITKTYASGEYDKTLQTIYKGARFSFYLLLLLGLPVLIQTEYIVKLWLGHIPEHTILFIKLTIIYAMSESLSGPLITAMLATGKIKNYQIVVGTLQVLNLPISYICLRNGCIPETVLIIAIILSQICFLARIYMLKSMIGLDIIDYLKRVYLNSIIVSIAASILPIIITYKLDYNFIHFVIMTIFSLTLTSLSVLFLGCNQHERTFIYSSFLKIKHKVFNR